MTALIAYAVFVTVLLLIALCGDHNLAQRNRALRERLARAEASNRRLGAELAAYVRRPDRRAPVLMFPRTLDAIGRPSLHLDETTEQVTWHA